MEGGFDARGHLRIIQYSALSHKPDRVYEGVWIDIWAALYWGTLGVGIRVERQKSHDLHTYQEIVAFSEGGSLDDGKRPYQVVLKVLVWGGTRPPDRRACLLGNGNATINPNPACQPFKPWNAQGRISMEERLTLCGDNCSACPRFLAQTESERRQVAELWYKIGWRDRIVSDAEIRCTGCSSHKDCTYHLVECTKRHGVKKCSQCTAFPCDTISDMLSRSHASQQKCRDVCSPKEYAVLENAFFHKEENLTK